MDAFVQHPAVCLQRIHMAEEWEFLWSALKIKYMTQDYVIRRVAPMPMELALFAGQSAHRQIIRVERYAHQTQSNAKIRWKNWRKISTNSPSNCSNAYWERSTSALAIRRTSNRTSTTSFRPSISPSAAGMTRCKIISIVSHSLTRSLTLSFFKYISDPKMCHSDFFLFNKRNII